MKQTIKMELEFDVLVPTRIDMAREEFKMLGSDRSYLDVVGTPQANDPVPTGVVEGLIEHKLEEMVREWRTVIDGRPGFVSPVAVRRTK